MKSISQIHSINSVTYTYMRLFINRRDVIDPDLLIHDMHTFNINTLITYTQRKHLTWKPIWEKPQRCPKSGMTNISAPFVCVLILQALFYIFFTTFTDLSPLMLSSLRSLNFSSPSLYFLSTHRLDQLSSLQLYNFENKPLYFRN